MHTITCVKAPRRRLTCRGDLASAARRAHLLATSLWELVNDGAAMVSRTSSLDSSSCYYAIVRGWGREWEEKNVSVVKGESIVCVATMESKWKGEKRLNTQGWRKQCSLFLLSTKENVHEEWRPSQHDLSFIHGPFEGRFNPKIALRPLSSS